MSMKIKRVILIVLVVLTGMVFVILSRHKSNPDSFQQEQKQEIQDNNKSQETEEENTNGVEQKTNKILSELTLQEKVTQMFIVTPDVLTEEDMVTTLGPGLRNSYQDYPVGGFIMMGANISSPEQISNFNIMLKELSLQKTGLLPFLCVDEEGGEVTRIASNDNFLIENVGNMSDVGSTGDVSNAYNAGVYIGGYLKNSSFNVNFAPDADLWINPDNSVVRFRAFGSEPELTARMVEQTVLGFHSQRICTALKHFPGHGATGQDSHEGKAYSQRTLEQLRQCEFLPFIAGIQAGTEFIMVGHIALPEVTGSDIPATLSPQIVTELLREELGYQGIVITDAMDMGAVTNYYSAEEAAVQAIQAGVDMILMPSDFEAAYQGVLLAVQNGVISEERLDESLKRIISLKIELQEQK